MKKEGRDRIMRHHQLTGDFNLSGGGKSNTYFDLRSAVLCDICREHLLSHYANNLIRIHQEKLDPDETDFHLVATGAFGALLLGALGTDWDSVLWNPKPHGVEWSGLMPSQGCKVVIVDDVITKGLTLQRVKQRCTEMGWEVIDTVVMWDGVEQIAD